MKKVVTWGQPKIASAKLNPGQYSSFREMFEKAQVLQAEQEQAVEYLQKAMPALVALLKFKLEHEEPLIVMRPLQYQTSELEKSDDDGFYVNRNPRPPKFIDVVKTIMPGTRLMIKSLDMSLQEFVFEDGQKREHSISFAERDKLLTQTNVFEEVRQFLESNKEK